MFAPIEGTADVDKIPDRHAGMVGTQVDLPWRSESVLAADDDRFLRGFRITSLCATGELSLMRLVDYRISTLSGRAVLSWIAIGLLLFTAARTQVRLHAIEAGAAHQNDEGSKQREGEVIDSPSDQIVRLNPCGNPLDREPPPD